ncbi:unnamed protein product [Protopolystoma xenopodis]|uniref:Uncharacterized protein n=1 Tax=Protopolystoma xenopodis TaxID=117903 RepID=A0A3S5ARF8_9PLAT|nr:unnamed protein product [Protopolystoma xenopodis]
MTCRDQCVCVDGNLICTDLCREVERELTPPGLVCYYQLPGRSASVSAASLVGVRQREMRQDGARSSERPDQDQSGSGYWSSRLIAQLFRPQLIPPAPGGCCRRWACLPVPGVPLSAIAELTDRHNLKAGQSTLGSSTANGQLGMRQLPVRYVDHSLPVEGVRRTGEQRWNRTRSFLMFSLISGRHECSPDWYHLPEHLFK